MKRRRIAVLLFWSLLPLLLFPAVFLRANENKVEPVIQTTEPHAAPALSPYAAKAGPELRAALTSTSPGELIRFIVFMKEEAPLQDVPLQPAADRRAAVVARLRQTASRSQESLRVLARALQDAGHIAGYQSLWIINGVAATGTPEAIRQIAALPGVREIRLDGQRRYFDPPARGINLERAFEVASDSDTELPWGVERIGADKAWDALGIDGTGVTVAIMDTGVDWLHPDLIGNYRGNLGNGDFEHSGNWYDTITPTNSEPIDLFGHGTHVAGTAVGGDGIGVAPGARWIAVSIANEFGFIYESDVHEGFQWIMAPDGDPGLAPDIVNNSWGGSSTDIAFYDDVKVLNAAGIIAVFSAGNEGPYAESINAPASYTDTLSVGASDELDEVAWFSSRGPSPLTADRKPWLVAPGTRVFSTLPDNQYGYYNGTSMAAPHVAGTIALLKSANPALSRAAVLRILADTAAPIGGSTPNNDSGWGRLDAYSAVASQVQTGWLQGQVSDSGTPLPEVTVTVTTASGVMLRFVTNGTGRYQAALRPGIYSLALSPFGFTPDSADNIQIISSKTTQVDFDLARLPGGEIRGTVRGLENGAPLTATVAVLGTPISTNSDSSGRYAVTLPEGRYQLRVSASGYRLGRASPLVTNGQTTLQDFSLPSAPTILLVDSGQWYYQSFASYYESSLDELDYAHDLRKVRSPVTYDLSASDLQDYDFVIWSAPRDSPGSLSANDVITDYLGSGGNLMISGQNVGRNDGYGFDTQLWWYRDLEGQFLGKTYVTQTVIGSPGSIFEGLSLTLNGGDSANNQTAIDRSQPRPGSLTQPALAHPDGTAAGLQAGHCDPFRVVYLGFGLEGVTDSGDRIALMERSFDYFQSPRLAAGVAWEPGQVDDFAPVGNQLSYTLTLRNLSETLTDTFRLSVANSLWPTALTTQTMTLGSCQSGQTVLTINVPDDLPRDLVHVMQISAVSTNYQSVSAAVQIRHKVPGRILLVDDDRWYDQEATFQAALDANGLSYDVWENGWDDQIRGSPPSRLLSAYDIVIWYTAYDWFAPVTQRENALLADYLAQGGRLFLTSQDFMYYHQDTPLAREYMGVVEYQESITPTQIFGGDNPLPPAALANPIPLEYGPYQNFSDGLIPGSSSLPFIWHDQGMPAGVATSGSNWRTVFWGIPFETLPEAYHAVAMNSIVGWLGDLGDTSFQVDRRSSSAGTPRTYTITLRNLPGAPVNKVTLTNIVPEGLQIIPGSMTGDAIYEADGRQLIWQGELASGASHVIRYQAIPDASLPAGARLDNTITAYYPRHNIALGRTASVWVGAPDLSGSTMAASVLSPARIQLVTYTLRLDNRGPGAAETATATIYLPEQLQLVTETVRASDGRIALLEGDIRWQGRMAPGDEITVSLVMTREISLFPLWLPAAAMIDDGVTDTLVRDTRPYLRPYQMRLAWIAND